MTAVPTEFADLPPTLRAERRGAVGVLTLTRREKRNALNDPTVRGIETFFNTLPSDIGAVVLAGDGEHFSSGLDLCELVERDIYAGVEHSRSWHRAFERIEFGRCRWSPCCRARWSAAGSSLPRPPICASPNARPSTRCQRAAAASSSAAAARCGCRALIGVARMMDMMLTGRTLSRRGRPGDRAVAISGRGRRRALQGPRTRRAIAGNAPLTNFAVMHALPRIARSDPAAGYAAEALMAAIAQGDGEAKARLQGVSGKARAEGARGA